MKHNFEEEFYDTLPLHRPDPNCGLNLMCRKTTKRIAHLHQQRKTSTALEDILRQYRDYALDNQR